MGGTGTVFDHRANPAVTGNNSWIWDVATDSTGHPVLTYATFPDDLHHQYHWARWDGTEWIDRILVNNAGPYIGDSSESNYSAGLVLDHTDPNIVYLSWMNAGTWNLQQWHTINGGQSWASQLIANGFGFNDENLRPYVPLGRPADTEMVMWLRGQYDYWNLTKGVGYKTGVQLWTNGAGSVPGELPEPAVGWVVVMGAVGLCGRNAPRKRGR